MGLKTAESSETSKIDEPKKEQPEKVEQRSLRVMTNVRAGEIYNYGDKVK